MGVTQNWLQSRLGDLAFIKTGSRNNQDKHKDGRYPFYVRSQDIERIDTYSYIDEAILIPGEGNIGSIVHYVNEPHEVHQRVYRISEFSSQIHPLYVYWYLKEFFKAHTEKYTVKATVDSLRLPTFQDFNIDYPALPEQKAIAKALSDIDELIEQTNRQLIKQTNLFTSVSEKLLNPRNNTEVAFQSYSLGKLGTTFGGLNGKSGKDFGTGSEYVTFLNVMNNLVLNPATVDYVEIGISEVQNRLRENDLVFNGSSETPEEAGLTSVVPKTLEGTYLNSFCFGFRFSKNEVIDPKYFALLSRSLVGRQIIGLLAQGSTRYNISKTELLKMQWPIPSIGIQRKTIEILSDILSLIENTKLAKAKYEFIKQGMAHDLLTGKVRLV